MLFFIPSLRSCPYHKADGILVKIAIVFFPVVVFIILYSKEQYSLLRPS